MIKKFLTAKHWQLFIVMFGIPIALQIFGMVQLFGIIENLEAMEQTGDVSPEFVMDSMFSFFGIFIAVIVITSLLLLTWLWSVGIGLQDKIADELKMKTGLFKIALIFPAAYFLLIVGIIGYVFLNIESIIAGSINVGFIFSIFPLHILSIVAMVYSLVFVAQTIKTAETQRKSGFGDYIGEFFMVWFLPIGIWILQPKINEIYTYEKENHEVEF